MGMPDASPAWLQACLADFGLAHSDVNPNPTTAAPAAAAAAAAVAAGCCHAMLPPSVTSRHEQMAAAEQTPSGYRTPSLPRSLADSPPRLAPPGWRGPPAGGRPGSEHRGRW